MSEAWRAALCSALVLASCVDSPPNAGSPNGPSAEWTGHLPPPTPRLKASRARQTVPVPPPELTANVEVSPGALYFGAHLVGTSTHMAVSVSSIGHADLEITAIEAVDLESGEPSSADFELLFTELPGGDAPSPDSPLVVPPESMVQFAIRFAPSAVSDVDESGTPILERLRIRIETNAEPTETFVEANGLGVAQTSPVAVGSIEEGTTVEPQTNLHLLSNDSSSPGGVISAWKWEVDQPAGSASVFVPTDTFPNPTFEANVIGEYTFRLRVWDENGQECPEPWEQTVLVSAPLDDIRVELLWHTPDDPDQTDIGPDAGADLDLHFVDDEYASGPDVDNDGEPDPWFDQPWDCFWFNAHPNWGSFDPAVDDDPSLDRDDTDGAGPELMSLRLAEDTTYRVGVHYWSDHGFGESWATVRVYIQGVLAYEAAHQLLVEHDMWNVATIEWPSGLISPMTGQSPNSPHITPNYVHPTFGAPDQPPGQ